MGRLNAGNLLVHLRRTFSIGAMKPIRFVDTTLRDGQQSLWAYGMRTGMIVPIAEYMDDAGFEAIELGGPVELPKCVRELREDPWERLPAGVIAHQENSTAGDSRNTQRIFHLPARDPSTIRSMHGRHWC